MKPPFQLFEPSFAGEVLAICFLEREKRSALPALLFNQRPARPNMLPPKLPPYQPSGGNGFQLGYFKLIASNTLAISLLPNIKDA
jgi:hypothetical protein